MNKLTILVVFFALAFAVSVQASSVSVSLRYQDTLVLDNVSFTLPAPGTLSITDTGGESRLVNAQSVLGVLALLDEADTSFELSKLQYFASFESLYLQCITLESEQCDNWLYAVNGTVSFVGMDAFVLTGGENIFVYFGPSRQVVLSATTVKRGTFFQATAQNYQYQDNTWASLQGVTIGFTQPDPDNPFSPTEVLLVVVDELGQISLNLDIPTGDYSVGIKEDFYFPSVQLSVTSSPSGGGIPLLVHRNFDSKKAIQFLALNQNEDGSFGSGALFTDWAAIAFGAYDEESIAKEKVRDYLLQNSSPGDFLTDYERRAMALMSLSINPYSGTKTNYIQKISDGFDGIQFGNPNLVNDDIFALLVLLNAGYEASEDSIAKTVEFILSSQQENGSFAGVDITAAAVQALVLVADEYDVSGALLNAKEYLISTQENSGGFGNVYATSWVMQAMAALGEKETSFIKNQNTPGDYLYTHQAEDGGVAKEDTQNNRIWATSYAIPASLSKTWDSILTDFKKPIIELVAQLTQEELEVFQVQIETLTNSIARTQAKILVALQLQEIQQEIRSIVIAIEVLQPQIASLHNAYLARLQLFQDQGFVQQQQGEFSQFSVLETGTITLGDEVAQNKEENRLNAGAASLLQNFFVSGSGQAVLVFGIGTILFLVLGGWRVVLSLVRRPRTVV